MVNMSPFTSLLEVKRELLCGLFAAVGLLTLSSEREYRVREKRE